MPLSVPIELAVRALTEGKTARQLGIGGSSGVSRPIVMLWLIVLLSSYPCIYNILIHKASD